MDLDAWGTGLVRPGLDAARAPTVNNQLRTGTDKGNLTV